MQRFLIGILVIIVGACTFYFGMNQLETAKASENWPMTKGEISSSEIDKTRKDNRDRYSADITYRYTVDGTNYTGRRLSFGEMISDNYEDAAAIVEKFPKGKDVEVYYDPQNPRDCVLEPGMKGKGIYVIQGAGVLFFLAGIYMIIGRFLKVLILFFIGFLIWVVQSF
jgi:hypothetical protein